MSCLFVYHVVVEFQAWKIKFKSLKRAHFNHRSRSPQIQGRIPPCTYSRTGVKLNPYFFVYVFPCQQQWLPPPVPRGVPLVSVWINKQKYKPAAILFTTSSMLLLLLFGQFSFPFRDWVTGLYSGFSRLIVDVDFVLQGEKRRVQPCTTARSLLSPGPCTALIFITKNSLPIERVWLIIAFNTCVSRLTLFFCSVVQHFAVGIFIFCWPFCLSMFNSF